MIKCYMLTYFIELIYNPGEIKLQSFESNYFLGETQYFECPKFRDANYFNFACLG